ncbi:MAG TPA: preprotein translocase subunit SecE [Candidatus Blautia faecavium]|uniref:Preprotein translocase subunit SecE n=1 Tax=Candidatus Blautia faecavium TaxID=2838487 RepID=A0A9D2LQV7_9FIRM|nr:preprotein translocase subunit SecE [Candidatus Blautia faecavium]
MLGKLKAKAAGKTKEPKQGKEKAGKTKGQKNNWFQGLQAEFKKIVWTDRKTLVKQTIAVVIITIILAILIGVMDAVILEGINLLVG